MAWICRVRHMTSRATPASWRTILGLGLLYLITLVATLPHALATVLFSATLMIPLVWLSVVDLSRKIIPDLASVLVGAMGIVAIWPFGWDGLGLHAVAALLVGGLFWAIGELYYRKTGVDGLGTGDAKLITAGTFVVGPLALPALVLFA